MKNNLDRCSFEKISTRVSIFGGDSNREPAGEEVGVELRSRHGAAVLRHDFLNFQFSLDVRRLEALLVSMLYKTSLSVTLRTGQK